FGTGRDGHYRQYVRTWVLAHWSSVKPAYRVALADGTELIASGDHRFLTERGWKHVTGSQRGQCRRPHLTVSNALLGTGGFVPGPRYSGEYERGYLSGMIRGDANLGVYKDARPGRGSAALHRFRIALADREALDRT